jgi:hypothetical protein
MRMTLPVLMEPFPVEWRLQRQVLAPKPDIARRSRDLGAAETPPLFFPRTSENHT